MEALPKAMLGVGALVLVASLLAKRILGEARADRLATNLALSFATLAIVLVGSEYGLRFLLREGVAGSGATQTYHASRWRRTVQLNAWGFRDRNFEPSKADNVYRVAVIGDSITYGQGVREEERFSNRLQADLDSNVEVLN